MNKEFLSELKSLYNRIDKKSDLFWALKNQSELIHARGSKSTRSKMTEEKKQEEKQWEKDTDAQFGYGEITQGAFRSLLTKM